MTVVGVAPLSSVTERFNSPRFERIEALRAPSHVLDEATFL
jgi:hypothetical protein